MFSHCHVIEKHVQLRTHSKRCAEQVEVAEYIQPLEDSRPAVGHEQPGEHIYGRGLAGAVMPQQSEDIALLYCKVEVFHCLLASETFVEVSNAEKISNRFPE